jgi:hypothetical protein
VPFPKSRADRNHRATITVLYLLTQIAYYSAVPKEDILGSTQIIAALFFENMFGPSAAKALSVFVALSAVANVFSVVFSQGRLNQALGRDGLIPFSKIFASNRPFKAPLAGLTWHVIVTLIILLAPPAGDVSSSSPLGPPVGHWLTVFHVAGVQLRTELIVISLERRQRGRLARITRYIYPRQTPSRLGQGLESAIQSVASGNSVLHAGFLLFGHCAMDSSQQSKPECPCVGYNDLNDSVPLHSLQRVSIGLCGMLWLLLSHLVSSLLEACTGSCDFGLYPNTEATSLCRCAVNFPTARRCSCSKSIPRRSDAIAETRLYTVYFNMLRC